MYPEPEEARGREFEGSGAGNHRMFKFGLVGLYGMTAELAGSSAQLEEQR